MCIRDSGKIADVGFHKMMAKRASTPHRIAHLIEISPVPSGEVVHRYDILVKPQQSLDKMGPDEPSAASYQPTLRFRDHALSYRVDRAH